MLEKLCESFVFDGSLIYEVFLFENKALQSLDRSLIYEVFLSESKASGACSTRHYSPSFASLRKQGKLCEPISLRKLGKLCESN